jgi:hypothetical protein
LLQRCFVGYGGGGGGGGGGSSIFGQVLLQHCLTEAATVPAHRLLL